MNKLSEKITVNEENLKNMTADQYKTVQRLKEYAASIGKNCEFEVVPNSDHMVKYVENVVNEDNRLEYAFRIYVRNDGSVRSMCYVVLNLEADDEKRAGEYFQLLNEKSDSVTYELGGNSGDMLFVTVYFDLEVQQYLQDDFEYLAFEYVQPAFECCFEGMVLLLENILTIEEAVNYALNEDKLSEDTVKRVRYSFEHEELCQLLLTDPECVILLKDDRENFLFNLMKILCENNGIEMPYEIEEFGVKFEKYGEYELIRMIMPKPVQDCNCLEIVLSIEEKALRYFTVEIGNKGKNLFICEWTLDEHTGERHHNYKMLNKKSKQYIAEIKKCLMNAREQGIITTKC